MEKILLRSLVVGALGLFAACSDGIRVTPPDVGNNDSQSAPTPTPPPANDGSITISQLTGNWQGGCQAMADNTLTNKLTFGGNAVVTDRTLVYSGSGCNGSPIVIVNMTGLFAIEGLSQTVTDATNFTINVTQVTGTPQSDLVASQLNFIGYCGYTDWQSGVAHNVSLNNLCLSDLPLRGNQIARITGNRLYFGNAAKTAIDLSVGYTKQ